jgi:DNA mismatch endonuclease (patch repair protein)
MKSRYDFKTTPQRSALMSRIRGINTKPEIALRKAIWNLGFRYRLNVPKLKGKPDIVFNKYKVIVFVDGEFWHGHNWHIKKTKIKANRKYWIKKIERNIERDMENMKHLQSIGYTVLRFWEQEIKKDLTGCVKKIVLAIVKNVKS